MGELRIEDRVFESAAELFSLLSTPLRLKIISAVCEKEKNVSELLAQIDTTQPNMSQHLSALHRKGVLSRRKEGTQVFYGLKSEQVATLCRAMCTHVTIETVEPVPVDVSDGWTKTAMTAATQAS